MYEQQTNATTPQPKLQQPKQPKTVSIEEWEDIVADKYQIPKGLWKAIPSQESGGKGWDAVSGTGVRGKYQVTEKTARAYGLDRNDPYQQVVAAARTLRDAYDSEKNESDEQKRWLRATGRYYFGDGAVDATGAISAKSRDGVSNPGAHLEKIAKYWGDYERQQKPQTVAEPVSAQPSPTPDPKAKTYYHPPDGEHRGFWTNYPLEPIVRTKEEEEAQAKVGQPHIWSGDETDDQGALTGRGMVIHKPEGVAMKESPAITKRDRDAARLIRNIESQRKRALDLFKQADDFDRRAAAGNAEQNRQSAKTLREQADAELYKANLMATSAQERFGDIVEAGFGKDADPNSKRQWAYAKAKTPDMREKIDRIDLRQGEIGRREAAEKMQVTPEQKARFEKQREVERLRKEFEGQWLPARLAQRWLTAASGGLSPDEQVITQPVNTAEEVVNRLGRGAVRAATAIPEGFERLAEAMPTITPDLFGTQARIQREKAAADARGEDTRPLAAMLTDAGKIASDQLLPVDPNNQSFWTAKLPEGLGSSVPFIASSVLGGGMPAAAAIGSAMNAQQVGEELDNLGVKDEATRQKATAVAGLIGSLEALGIEGKLGKVFGGRGGLVKRLMGAGSEGVQEWTTEELNDINAKLISAYDPKRSIDPLQRKQLEAAALGALTGGLFEAGGKVAEVARDRQAVRQTAAERPATPTDIQPTTIGPTQITPLDPRAAKSIPRDAASPLAAPEVAAPVAEVAAQIGVQPEEAQQVVNQAVAEVEAETGQVPPEAFPLLPESEKAARMRQRAARSGMRDALPFEVRLNDDLNTAATLLQSPDAADQMEGQRILNIALREIQQSPGYLGEVQAQRSGQKVEATPYSATKAAIQSRLKGIENAANQAKEAEKSQKEAGQRAEKLEKYAATAVQRGVIPPVDAIQRSFRMTPDEATAFQASIAGQIEGRTSQTGALPQAAQTGQIPQGRPTDALPTAALPKSAKVVARAPFGEGYQPAIEQFTQGAQMASRSVEAGRFADARDAYKRQIEALKIARANINRRTAEGAKEYGRLGTRIAGIERQIGDLRQAQREAAKQANAPTKGLANPATFSRPESAQAKAQQQDARDISGDISAPLLRPDAVQNPEGGIPQMPEPTFTDRLESAARRDEAARGKAKPAKRLLSRIAELGGISYRYAGELQDVKDARRIGVIRQKAEMSPDVLARQLQSEGYDVDPEDLNTLWEAARRDIAGRDERTSQTSELERRLAEEEAAYNERQEQASPSANQSLTWTGEKSHRKKNEDGDLVDVPFKQNEGAWRVKDDLGGEAYGNIVDGVASIIGMESVPPSKRYTNEAPSLKRRGFFRSLIKTLQANGARSIEINMQSADTQAAVRRLLQTGELINPREMRGSSLNEHPTLFDIPVGERQPFDQIVAETDATLPPTERELQTQPEPQERLAVTKQNAPLAPPRAAQDYRGLLESPRTPQDVKARKRAIAALMPFNIQGNKSELLAKGLDQFVDVAAKSSKRVIDAFGGAGTYTHYLRSKGLGREGDVLNEYDPLRYITHKQIKENPQAVGEAARRTVEDLKRLTHTIQEGTSFTEEHANIRRQVTEYFRRRLMNLTQPGQRMTGKIRTGEPVEMQDSPELAGLYTVLQNQAFNFLPVQAEVGKKGFKLPGFAVVGNIGGKVGVFVKGRNLTLNAPANIAEAGKRFQGLNVRRGDGWELIRKDAGDGDFVPVDTSYLNKEGQETTNYSKFTQEDAVPEVYVQKVQENLLPAWERGAKLLITNNWDENVASYLSSQGFRVFKDYRQGASKNERAAGGAAELIAINFDERTGQVFRRGGNALSGELAGRTGQTIEQRGSALTRQGRPEELATGTQEQAASLRGRGNASRPLANNEQPAFQPDTADLREVREFAKREPRTEQFTEEPPTAPLARRRQPIRPPAPASPRQVGNRPLSVDVAGTRTPVAMSPDFPRARREMVKQGREVEARLTEGQDKGEFGNVAEAMFKSNTPDVLHGQDSFFHDPDLKGKLGLTREAEMADVRRELKTQLARSLGLTADEVSLSHIKPEVWRAWAKQKGLGREAVRKLEAGIARAERKQRAIETNAQIIAEESQRAQSEVRQPAAEAGKSIDAQIKEIRDLQKFDLIDDKEAKRKIAALEAQRPKIAERREAPGFFSQLERVIDAKMPAKASAAQVRAIIENPQSGVKPEEVKWTGLDDYLRTVQNVTKEDVLNWLKANQIDVQEVESGKKAYAQYALPGAKEGSYRELLLTLPKKTTEDNYKSSHFDELNILAHIRFNEHTDNEDKRVLHIEEIQSDWHQEGRKKGYATAESLAEQRSQAQKANAMREARAQGLQKQEQLHRQIVSLNMELKRLRDGQSGALTEDQKKIKREIGKLESLQYQFELTYPSEMEIQIAESAALSSLTPDAPFKKNWHELAFKRALRWAAENGYERLTWTTGEQQAERFDLSKQVDSIDVNQMPAMNEKAVKINFAGNNGASQFSVNEEGIVSGSMDLNGKRLDEVIGKEMAEKIMATDNAVLSGQDLKVGGEGMKGFYDQILPAFANKYGRKWGVKVGEAKIDVSLAWQKAKDEGETETVHSIDITPAMRESVMQGQPKFRREASGAMPERYTGRQLFENAQLTFRPARNRPATLVANDWGGAMLNRLLSEKFDVTTTDANFTIGAKDAKDLRDYLADAKDSGIYEPAQVANMDAMLKQMDAAIADAEANQQDVAFVTRRPAEPISATKAKIRHEAAHLSQSRIAADLSALTGKNWLDSQPNAADIHKELDRRGYKPETHDYEAAAFVASGDYGVFGMNLDQAAKFLSDYFGAVVEKHGKRALQKFGAIDPKLQPTLEAARRETAIGQSENQRGSSQAAQGSARRVGATSEVSQNRAGVRTERRGRRGGISESGFSVGRVPEGRGAVLASGLNIQGLFDRKPKPDQPAPAKSKATVPLPKDFNATAWGEKFYRDAMAAALSRTDRAEYDAAKTVREKNAVLLGADVDEKYEDKIYDLVDRVNDAVDKGDGAALRKVIQEASRMTREKRGSIRKNVFETIGAGQAAVQLATPGFVGRNILQHASSAIQSGISDRLASAIDAAFSAATKTPRAIKETGNPVSQTLEGLRNYKKGLKEGWEKHKAGADLGSGKLIDLEDLPTNKIANGFRELLFFINDLPDAGNYVARYERALKSLVKADERNKTPMTETRMAALTEQAKLEADHASLRDDNFISHALKHLKTTLNHITSPVTGTDKFGLGDFIVKYTQVPGALVKRSIEYSPLGLIEAGWRAQRAVRGIGSDFERRSAIQALSRAITGTGSTLGMGAALFLTGILVPPEKDDYTSEQLERARGVRGFSVNLSALARLAPTLLNGEGFSAAMKVRDGDKLIPIDWVQPWAMGASVGATLAKDWKEGKLSSGSATKASFRSLSNALEIMGDQSVLKNVREYLRAAKGKTFTEIAGNVTEKFVKSAPQSFAPGITRQIGGVIDPGVRDYRPESRKGITNALKEGLTRTATGTLPGLSLRYPEKLDPITGKPMKTAQGERTVAQRILSLFSPQAINEYKADSLRDEIIRLNDYLEEKDISLYVPPLSSQQTRIKGYEEPTRLLRQRETEFAKEFAIRGRRLVESPRFAMLSDDKKADALRDLISDIRQKTYKSGTKTETLKPQYKQPAIRP